MAEFTDFNAVDVAIIGGGPAGYFTAIKIKEECPDADVAIFEAGPLRKRADPDILSGWGGAGTFSDGKLILSPEVGGWLEEFIEQTELLELIGYVENTYLKFGFPEDRVFGIGPAEKIEELRVKTRRANLTLRPYKVRHAGTDGIYRVTAHIYKHLLKTGVKICLNSPIEHVRKLDDGKIELEMKNGKKVTTTFAVLAPGRAGSDWLRREEEILGLRFVESKKVGVDEGIRVEVPFEIMQEYTDILHEFKIEKLTECFDDYVRTFCVCPHGHVKLEKKDGLYIVNGHSFANPKRWSKNTNFAILVRANFTYPFRDPISYALLDVKKANDLGGGKPLIQRLGDLRGGRRSTWDKITKGSRGVLEPTLKEVEPGDLSYALSYRIMRNVLEFLENLEGIFPGINDKHTLLYGVETKLYSSRVELREGFETMIDNLFTVGDGSGCSRSIAHAAVMGVKAAQTIAKKRT